MKIEFTDNSEEILAAMLEAKIDALEICGQKAEDYAKLLAVVAEEHGGTLRGSITHRVVDRESTVYIGTNVEYAPYVEFGTGKYTPGGRQDPWVYQDDEGEWHRTEGVEARPFLVPAVADHRQEYLKTAERMMKGE